MDSLVAFSRRRRRWILLAALGTASAYGAYKIYHLPAVAARRRRLVRLAAALAAFLDAAASSADAAALVSSDLADFVRSDSDQLPRSVTQLAKLAASPEVSSTVSALSQAVAAGILRGVGSTSEPGSGDKVALSDRLVDKLFSESGERLMSAVAGSFARQLIIGFYSAPSPPGETSSSSNWVNVVATGKGHKAISSWLEVLIGTAVGVFIEKTIHINTYQQLFEGLTNPSHDAKVKELLVSVCNGAVETVVKTSHHVMSKANGKLDDKGSANGSSRAGEGWVETVSSTLAVPSNRKLVLDVTGRVTFETVRSFLEFVLWKLHDGARKSGDTMFDSGLRAMSNSATAIWLLLAGIIILHVSFVAVSLPVCAVAFMTSLNGALVRAADLSGSKANCYRSWLYWPGSFPRSTFFGVPVLYENVIHLDWQQVFALPAFVVAYRFWSTPLRNEFLAVRAADVSGSKVVC